MRAIVQDRYGSADVLRLAEVDAPEPGEGEVLVRVRAAAVGAATWHLMTGLPRIVRLSGTGLRRPKIPVPGTDLAGTVEAVGTGVTGLAPGDEVFGEGIGTLAEYARAPRETLVPKPQTVTFEQAAAVTDSGHTALVALRDVGGVAAGQRVLVTGAGGGVGSFAVQIARAWGAEVTGVCSTTKLELVRSLGAAHVIDYMREDFTDRRGRWDVLVDTAGNRPLSRLRRALTPRGTLVIVGGEGGGRWFGPASRLIRALLLSPLVSQKLRGFVSMPTQDGILLLHDLLGSGRVVPVIERVYALAEAPRAIRRWERGHTAGKLVVTI